MADFDISSDSIAKARASGYSDVDIVNYLSPKAPDKFGAAQKAGYSPTEILDHLAPPDQGGPVDISTGLTFEGLKHAATVPTEAAKGVPVAGAYVPDTADTKKFEQDQPVLAAATRGIGSALALAPAMAIAPEVFGFDAAGSLLGNTLTGAITGGTISAADAAARGESAADIGKQAITGGLTGGAAPMVGKAIGSVVQGIMKYFKPAEAEGILKGVNPQALEWASKALKDQGFTDQQIAARVKELGPEGFLAEYTPKTLGSAAAVTSLPGAAEGKNALLQGFEQRVAPGAQKARIQEGLDNLLGKPKNMVQSNIENAAAREAEAGPLFDQFRQMKVTPTAEVKSLTEQLEGLGLLNDAKRVAQVKAAATGEPVAPTENFFTTGERKDWPTTESWSYVKQAVDDKIANSYDAHGHATQNTRLWRQLKKRIDNVIANSSPETAKVWGQARDIWESSKAVDNARAEGARVWARTYHPDQLIQDLTDMSPAERAAFKEGARSALQNNIEASVNGDTTTRQMLRSDFSKQKMHMLAENKSVKPAQVDEFLNQMEREPQFAANKSLLGTTSQKEAVAAAKEEMTPKAEDLFINQLKQKYSPHVTPFAYIPILSKVGKAVARHQEAGYEAARNELGKLLATKGSKAEEVAKALLNYAPKGRGKVPAELTTGTLLQALAPKLPGTPIQGQ